MGRKGGTPAPADEPQQVAKSGTLDAAYKRDSFGPLQLQGRSPGVGRPQVGRGGPTPFQQYSPRQLKMETRRHIVYRTIEGNSIVNIQVNVLGIRIRIVEDTGRVLKIYVYEL